MGIRARNGPSPGVWPLGRGAEEIRFLKHMLKREENLRGCCKDMLPLLFFFSFFFFFDKSPLYRHI